MSNHLSMRSGNPGLKSDTFRKHLSGVTAGTMTIEGTVHKTGFALLLLMVSASVTWANPNMIALVIPALIAGVILALITIFKPTAGYITVPLYAVAEGLALRLSLIHI